MRLCQAFVVFGVRVAKEVEGGFFLREEMPPRRWVLRMLRNRPQPFGGVNKIRGVEHDALMQPVETWAVHPTTVHPLLVAIVRSHVAAPGAPVIVTVALVAAWPRESNQAFSAGASNAVHRTLIERVNPWVSRLVRDWRAFDMMEPQVVVDEVIEDMSSSIAVRLEQPLNMLDMLVTLPVSNGGS